MPRNKTRKRSNPMERTRHFRDATVIGVEHRMHDFRRWLSDNWDYRGPWYEILHEDLHENTDCDGWHGTITYRVLITQ